LRIVIAVPGYKAAQMFNDRQVILQHCPKIASGEAWPSPSREPEDVRFSLACVGGADCRKGEAPGGY